jgi:hypothetical protein
MWPVNADVCIKLVKKFNNSAKAKEPTLSLLRHHQFDEVAEMGQALQHRWGPKIARNTLWRDPTDEASFRNFVNDSEKVVFNTLVDKTELNMWRTRRTKELKNKRLTRRRLPAASGTLELTKEDAEQAIAAKLRKEEEIKKKRADVNFIKM